MPETFYPGLFSEETEQKMLEASKEGDDSSNTKAQILKDDINYVGEGGRVIVAATEQDPEKLVAISMKEVSPQMAKTVYYNHKLLKTMFPNNFPHIYAAWGREGSKGVSANFRENINGRQLTKQEAQAVHAGKSVTSQEHPFSRVLKTAEELGIPLHFDKNERNYRISDFRDEMFVDTIDYKNWTTEQKEAVLEFMKNSNYNDEDLKTATACLDRLLEINKEN